MRAQDARPTLDHKCFASAANQTCRIGLRDMYEWLDDGEGGDLVSTPFAGREASEPYWVGPPRKYA